jgi:hypothetical protein
MLVIKKKKQAESATLTPCIEEVASDKNQVGKALLEARI